MKTSEKLATTSASNLRLIIYDTFSIPLYLLMHMSELTNIRLFGHVFRGKKVGGFPNSIIQISERTVLKAITKTSYVEDIPSLSNLHMHSQAAKSSGHKPNNKRIQIP